MFSNSSRLWHGPFIYSWGFLYSIHFSSCFFIMLSHYTLRIVLLLNPSLQIQSGKVTNQLKILNQKITIFFYVFRYNIQYGRLSAGDADIINSAKQADIHNRILTFPNGYDTEVGCSFLRNNVWVFSIAWFIDFFLAGRWKRFKVKRRRKAKGNYC